LSFIARPVIRLSTIQPKACDSSHPQACFDVLGMEPGSRTAVRVRRRRSTAQPLGAVLSGTILTQTQEQIALGQESLTSFSIFPQFVNSRATIEATLRFPAERVQGIIATYLFIATLTVLALVLVVSMALYPSPQTVTIRSPSVAQYDAIAGERPACPCSQVESVVNQSMVIELLHDPMCQGQSMYRASIECARSVQCSGQGLDRTLSSLSSICRIADQVQERITDVAKSRRLVSPQLMARSELESLASATAATAMADVQSWLNVPFSIVESVVDLERPVTLEGIAGSTPAQTAVFRSAGVAPVAVRQGQERRWMPFAMRPCIIGNSSRADCEAFPHCVFRPGQQLQCDSRVCPRNLTREECVASPSCEFAGQNGDLPSACTERSCRDYTQDVPCETPLRGGAAPWAFQPEEAFRPCQLVKGPSRTSCEARLTVCGDYKSARDCSNLAPRRLCHWDAARQVCGYISDWSCPGGRSRSSCGVKDAVNVSTNDEAPTYLMEGSMKTGSQEPASGQPDVLVFNRFDKLSNPTLAPLWRTAVGRNCSCLDDFDCSSPARVGLLPGEGEGKWDWSCTRSKTISTYSLNIFASGIWEANLGVKDRPLNGTSSFKTFGEAFSQAFLVGSRGTADFDVYFATCAPSTCTYTSNVAPSALDVVTSVLAVIGGLTVIVQNAVVYGVKYLLGPFIEAYVRARPEVYGESPAPAKVSELLAEISAADSFVEEEAGDGGEACGSDEAAGRPSAALGGQLRGTELTPTDRDSSSVRNPLTAQL
jgi:hypothetical protein